MLLSILDIILIGLLIFSYLYDKISEYRKGDIDMTQTNNIIIPSSPEDRLKIKNALAEISNCYTRIEAERDVVKDILQTIEENQGIPKKYMRKMARIHHKQNFVEVQQEYDDLETLYESISV